MCVLLTLCGRFQIVTGTSQALHPARGTCRLLIIGCNGFEGCNMSGKVNTALPWIVVANEGVEPELTADTVYLPPFSGSGCGYGSNRLVVKTHSSSEDVCTCSQRLSVPAAHAWLPPTLQLFARISMDDSIAASVSTFAGEMREAAHILDNAEAGSLVIIDELGRGTSPRDGMAIALAICESLVETRAYVWFATHFKELAEILSERAGVMNLHMKVEVNYHLGRSFVS